MMALGYVLCIIAVVLMTGVGVYSFGHPDMTETRVFINCAPAEAVAVLCGLSGSVIVGNSEDGE